MHSASPPLRMSGEDRRRQLLEVAIDLFSQKGFGGTTTKEIAAAAGVTEAMIFRHFATKQDLYKAILDYKCAMPLAETWMSEAQSYMDASDDEGLFRFLITQIIAFDRDQTKFARLLAHAALEGHELAIMHHDQLGMPVGKKFKEYIARRQAQGALRGSEPGLVILALAGVAQFYSMKKYVYQHGDLPFEDEAVTAELLNIVLHGLKADSPGLKADTADTKGDKQ